MSVLPDPHLVSTGINGFPSFLSPLFPSIPIQRDTSYISVDSEDLTHFQQTSLHSGHGTRNTSSNSTATTHTHPGSIGSAGHRSVVSGGANTCKLLVKYLPPQLNQEQLHALFSPFGTLLSCKLILDKKTGSSLGYGFVIYSSYDQASAAIQQLNGYVLNNRPIRVSLAQPPDVHSNNSKSTVYLSGLPIQYGLAELTALTGAYGTVLDSKILCDVSTGISRGIGFVQMDSSSSARKCIESLHGKILQEGGEALIVKFAKEFRRDSFHNNAIQPQPGNNAIINNSVYPSVNTNPSTSLSSVSSGGNPSVQAADELAALYLQHQQAAAVQAVAVQTQLLLQQQAQQAAVHANLIHHAQQSALTHTNPMQHSASPLPSPPNITQLTNLLANASLTPAQLRAIESQYGNKKSGYSLFVFHLPPELTESELTCLFSLNNTVQVMSVSLALDPSDPEGKLSRGFGFVNMCDFQGALKCVRLLNGMQLGRKFIKVQFKNKNHQQKQTIHNNIQHSNPTTNHPTILHTNANPVNPPVSVSNPNPVFVPTLGTNHTNNGVFSKVSAQPPLSLVPSVAAFSY